MADNKEVKKEPKKEAKKQIKAYKPGKLCPKCSSHMAEHSDRLTCGKCGYTEFKAQNKPG
ncbi:MAG: 30S ribosomal protein S27ae [Candidatus Micrarchaeota archaeon]|nr:30S ribosomal protein S27ae [Candidatus Micrarchaeota archaeon]